ncbi:hypothetical protein P170DRAFT_505611 [Aspergillus steynii IBT 23096]|uniref:Uncharacterized protein n=1 Tax=Aspergillus steynii IBT 23096 TaxID=1392250 RepID=A0A2I2GQ24_9EURO|nr:uncharacterized protein P170DRAFT_505611 [Aspergillus steynii IBT 23096]PLB54978.1 hypothetical protein P170DRAFT_505611 [Aspergillus steynii IBT 23096]
MIIYSSLPLFDVLLERAETDTPDGNWTKGLAMTMLQHYFPVADNWRTVYELNSNHRTADFRILRLQRFRLDDRKMVNHTVALAKKDGGDLDAALKQLEDALERTNIESGRCWAMLFHGLDFLAYEYYEDLPENQRLIPTGPPSQPCRSRFDMRTDGLAVEEMLMHMRQHEAPSPR